MANEINIQAALTFQRFTPAVLLGAGAKDITQTGKEASCATQSLTNTSAVAAEVGNVPDGTLGFIFIKNLNAEPDTKTLTVLSGTTAFGKLKAGQFCLIPVNSVVTASSIKVQASAGTIDVLVVAAAE
jgi:hypothetical protein